MAKFKARARTIDMLGRQQIANISTAISELFKNAYDAYAENARVDYFRSDNLLAIRDDGIGMTLEDFENKWLVLGTESKLEGNRKGNQYRPPNREPRPIMGEKGIGRLAIALLGRQVLILTRAERGGQFHDLVACYIHWGLFEIPGINLDQIEFPIRTYSKGSLPSEEDIEELIEEFRENIKDLAQDDSADLFDNIYNDLNDFQFDPNDMDDFLEGSSLQGNNSGTHFYVAEADPIIAAEIGYERVHETKDFSKFLLGFSNSVFRESPPPPIKTSFNYWETDNVCEDLIGESEFFTNDELVKADHHVSGKIDKYGQFKGNVRIYDSEIVDHIISWQGSVGTVTACGPFEIDFGYVPGALRDSKMDPEEWHLLNRKLQQIGGIYVFRDRIRILPYGNSDVDWLGIEERRTKSAAYYFFSHRRVFGAVKLTRNKNGNLHEKAGREGFRQDKAYKQLRDILENLFLQLAGDFFRESGENSEYFIEQKEELNRLELARRKREKMISVKKKSLVASLKSFFDNVSEGLPQTQLHSLRESIRSRMSIASQIKDPDLASSSLLEAERNAYQRLEKIKDSYKLSKPRGFSPSKELQRDWDSYAIESKTLENRFFEPFEKEIAQTLGEVATEAKLYVDQRKRLQDLIKQQADASRKMVRKEVGEIKSVANETRSEALKFTRDAIKEMQEAVANVEVEFAQTDLTNRSNEEIEKFRDKLETKIETVGRKNSETLSKVRDMLTAISSNLAQGVEVSESDVIEAMDHELNELRERAEADAELVQLGLAIAIINHEFEAAIKGIRRALKDLRSWAKEDDELDEVYLDIRKNFDHLDGHLNLFTPLQRRLYRNAIEVTGADIHHYLKTLFESRLKRHKVSLNTSDRFLDSKFTCYPSTLYPVFVNIIDNSIFWAKSVTGKKAIILDADKSGYLISNNGPIIKPVDYDNIFEQGFSRKPLGRGLGLFISKKALQKEGMDISVLPSDDDMGATFKVSWPRYD